MLFQVLRFSPKKFRQRRPNPDNPGQWIPNLKGVSRVLYRLPEVIEAVERGEIIWLVEGEKDADRLVKAGLCATTWPGGAKSKGFKWNRNYSKSLGGARVAVIPDNDAAGIATAQTSCDGANHLRRRRPSATN